MPEILFRGKRTDNGEWVQGFYVVLGNENHCIFTGRLDITRGRIGFEYFKVDPKTVGQFTGLTDKNGNKIFEGDIIHLWSGEHYSGYWEHDTVKVVEDITDDVCVIIGEVEYVEVIGNIHDNPELLK